jgi:hypothetical protein
MKFIVILVLVLVFIVIIVGISLVMHNEGKFLRLHQQLEENGNDFRELINAIKSKHNMNTPLFFYNENMRNIPANSYLITETAGAAAEELKYISGSKHILCKTKSCFDILNSNNKNNDYNIYYLGTSSKDIFDLSLTKNYEKFVHIYSNKYTKKLKEYWDSSWPALQIVNPKDSDLIEIINKNSIFVLPCSEENIHKVKSAGSLILFAAGENQYLVDNLTGIEIVPAFSKESLAAAVSRVLSMNIQRRRQIGENARADYLKRHNDFVLNFMHLFGNGPQIPHKIHFVWIDAERPYENSDFPHFYQKNIDQWKKNHPNYEVKIWLGKDCFDLICGRFSSNQVEKYKNIGLMNKCDLARVVIVNTFGGFYVDLDIISRFPMKECYDSIFYLEPEEHFKKDQAYLINGFFGAVPNNPFCTKWIEEILNKKIGSDNIIGFAGPGGLFNYFLKSHDLVNIGDTCNISPFLSTGKYVCNGIYNNDKAIIWWDTTGWGKTIKKIGKKVPKYFRGIENPLNGKVIMWKTKITFDRERIITLNNLTLNEILIEAPAPAVEYLFLAHARPDLQIKIAASDIIEEICLLNGLGNVMLY